MSDVPVNLLDFDLDALAAWCEALGEKRFRAVQLFRWIHQRTESDFSAMSDLARSLREKLTARACVAAPPVLRQSEAADGTIKWLFDVGDGNAVEAVYIPEDDRGTLCVSSQAGCAVGCRFCATGHQGFSRNLTTAEIMGQLWFAERFVRQRLGVAERVISNVVLMGMGEPLQNYRCVLPALRAMLDDHGWGMSQHAPRDFITIEYCMLGGVNDAPEQAEALIALLRRHSLRAKFNLIPFNPFPLSGLERSPQERVRAFAGILNGAGIVTTIRRARGDDIAAACGQLAGDVRDRTRAAERMARRRTIPLHLAPTA